MVIVAGKTADLQDIAGFLMGLKPDIISINHSFRIEDLLANVFSLALFRSTTICGISNLAKPVIISMYRRMELVAK